PANLFTVSGVAATRASAGSVSEGIAMIICGSRIREAEAQPDSGRPVKPAVGEWLKSRRDYQARRKASKVGMAAMPAMGAGRLFRARQNPWREGPGIEHRFQPCAHPYLIAWTCFNFSFLQRFLPQARGKSAAHGKILCAAAGCL